MVIAALTELRSVCRALRVMAAALSPLPLRMEVSEMDYRLYPTNCDECNQLFAYMESHPRGYMICPSCYERKLEQEREQENEGSHP